MTPEDFATIKATVETARGCPYANFNISDPEAEQKRLLAIVEAERVMLLSYRGWLPVLVAEVGRLKERIAELEQCR